jgi:hypothetical protein
MVKLDYAEDAMVNLWSTSLLATFSDIWSEQNWVFLMQLTLRMAPKAMFVLVISRRHFLHKVNDWLVPIMYEASAVIPIISHPVQVGYRRKHPNFRRIVSANFSWQAPACSPRDGRQQPLGLQRSKQSHLSSLQVKHPRSRPTVTEPWHNSRQNAYVLSDLCT